MVENIILDMYKNTDDNNTLYINGWSEEPEEVLSFPRFYRCRMNWDFNKAGELARQASDICKGLFALGSYYEQTGQKISAKPDTLSDDDSDTVENALSVWEMFFGGYDHDSITADEIGKLAQQRLGGKTQAHNTFVFARRILTALRLGAPSMIVDWQIYGFARCFALTKASEEMSCLDITKDTFDSETQSMGEYSSEDLKCVFELIRNDRTILPDEKMGCVLLVSKIFSSHRLDLYRRSDLLVTADAVLQTLTKCERTVIEKLYGLKDGARNSIDQTALELNMPTPMAEYYETVALRKLRHPSRSEKLEKLL